MELQLQAEADFAAERALVDEIVARIQQEDRMDLAARRTKQAETKVSCKVSDRSSCQFPMNTVQPQSNTFAGCCVHVCVQQH